MILTINNIISIERLVDTWWEKQYTNTVATWVNVFIEPVQEQVLTWMDGESSFTAFYCFSDFELLVWDKLTDKNLKRYKVKWTKKFDSLVWKHYESLIYSIYD